ncbi:MAG: hypothetical protein JSU09_01165 [Bacteroidetes bacterium]|nr:hypothetical protein [Bacteroidota bacterium]
MLSLIQKIPIITTIFSFWFAWVLHARWKSKAKPEYLFWWMVGVFCYGLGTFTESWVGLLGWNTWIFKAWYISGALLGGFPLAQGSVYLMFSKSTANKMMMAVIALIFIASVLVVLSPIKYELVETTRLTGKVLDWKFVRLMTPFVNLYAFVFLVGGAAYSAYRYSKDLVFKNRFVGNVLIAFGGLLPGIGGSFTKFGYTEVLYVTEIIGIILIYTGYATMRKDTTLSLYSVQNT